MKSIRSLALLAGLSLTLLATPALATPVLVETMGVVVGSPMSGTVDPNFTLGERVAVAYTLESTAPPSSPGNYATALISMTIDFLDSGRSYSFTGGPVVVVNDLLGLDGLLMSGANVVSASPIGGVIPDINQLEFIDGTGTMFNSTALPTTPLPYTSGRIGFAHSSGSLDVEVFFQSVPEPALLALLILGAAGTRVRRDRAR